ncbi:caspase-1-like [Belonocnema kinseyi]|uniref:caspase-1-like n=1 Tax=Belonocnema kinseyi TaxID=2817044 RepID=UPI00143CE236|nr:caspase-1-like [Belonocnema kinseyi]
MDTRIPSATKGDKLNSEDAFAADKVRQHDVDGWLFRKPKEKYESAGNYSKSRLDPNSETYDMNHERRGVALIFNHINFKKMTPRKGTIKDCTDFSRVLKCLGFEVRVYADKSTKHIQQVLKSTAAEDHSNSDCFLVAVMTHGESGFLHSCEELYPVDTLWNFFTGEKCTTLAGKPKLFFIQACRGERLDKGVKIIHETDSGSTYSIPAYADILVAYSTYDGYYSWRNQEAGSWFIQAICEEFEQSARTRDLLTMLTFVNRRVAIEYQSYVPQNRHFHERKQIPSIVSMLTRLVYFTQKETIKSSSNQIESFQKIYAREAGAGTEN